MSAVVYWGKTYLFSSFLHLDGAILELARWLSFSFSFDVVEVMNVIHFLMNVQAGSHDRPCAKVHEAFYVKPDH